MNSNQFKRWLAEQGCTFETKKGGCGHCIVRLGDKKSEIPLHGAGKELKKGLIEGVKKQLGLK